MTGPDLVETGGLKDWGWDPSWAAAFDAFAGSNGDCRWAPASSPSIAAHGCSPPSWVSGLRRSPVGCRHEARDGQLPAVEETGSRACGRRTTARPVSTAYCPVAPRSCGGRLGRAWEPRSWPPTSTRCSWQPLLNGDLNPRRLERYVAMGRESGAEPVVLLTKADLVQDAAEVAARLEGELRVAVVASSARSRPGVDAIATWLSPGRTSRSSGRRASASRRSSRVSPASS